MRCKVKLESLTKTATNGASVIFTPVTNGSMENQKFFKYTPAGKIELFLLNESVVENLKVGSEYYIDFMEAA